MPVSLQDRFWPKVLKSENCWDWIGQLSSKGYGRFYIGKPNTPATVQAHRFAYELMIGTIPDGLVLDHLCRNRKCVNPNHLEPVTDRVNVMRGETIPAAQARKTHCVNGHEFTEKNTRHI